MTSPLQAASPARRNLLIATGILALHAALLWAVQNGLQLRAAPMLVPITLLSELPAPPAPPRPLKAQNTAAAPALALAAPPQPTEATAPLLPAAQASPAQPVAEAKLIATGNAQNMLDNTPTPAAAAALPATPATLQLPSSNADYLQNPKPPYPPISARLGEAGKTVYRVWIGLDGKPQRAELVSSSGFARLDRAAYDTVMGWRYVPGKRGGVAEIMAFNVPIHWELRN
jgi:protein TonB